MPNFNPDPNPTPQDLEIFNTGILFEKGGKITPAPPQRSQSQSMTSHMAESVEYGDPEKPGPKQAGGLRQ